MITMQTKIQIGLKLDLPGFDNYNPRFVDFYPIIHRGLYCRAVSARDNLGKYLLNKEILQFFEPKIHAL